MNPAADGCPAPVGAGAVLRRLDLRRQRGALAASASTSLQVLLARLPRARERALLQRLDGRRGGPARREPVARRPRLVGAGRDHGHRSRPAARLVAIVARRSRGRPRPRSLDLLRDPLVLRADALEELDVVDQLVEARRETRNASSPAARRCMQLAHAGLEDRDGPRVLAPGGARAAASAARGAPSAASSRALRGRELRLERRRRSPPRSRRPPGRPRAPRRRRRAARSARLPAPSPAAISACSAAMRASTAAFSSAGSSAAAGPTSDERQRRARRGRADRRPIGSSFAHRQVDPPPTRGLERLQRRGHVPAKRADERAVVLVGDLPVRWSNSSSFSAASARSRSSASSSRRRSSSSSSSSASDSGSGSRRNGSATTTTQATASSRAEHERQRSTRRGQADRGSARDEPPLLARVRPERDQRAEQEDEPGEPDQVHERLDEDLEVDRSRSGRSARRSRTGPRP